MKLQFMGAAGTVTGSRTLVTTGEARVLVDCGMFQGFKANRLRNWEALDVGPLDAVVLTHAHIDHSGWVPALVRRGYSGPVYCTSATAALLQILWPDAGRIQEEDAEYLNRKGATKHTPAEPMYTELDALEALKRVVPVELHAPFAIGGLTVTFRSAGHILGAASVELASSDRKVLFSGDLGRSDDDVVPAPEPPSAVDVVVMESTYGNREHPDIDRMARLEGVVNRTVERGGMLLVPSFAVGRAQGLLWAFHRLMEAKRIPRLPIVVDSPMATRATDAFLAHPDALRLTPDQLRAMTRNVEFTGTVEASKALNARTEPFILIAASGMLTGGRVLHHLVQRGPTKRNTLLFVGFQAPGTRGGQILAGERTIRMFGNKVKLRCDLDEIGGFSAHADASDLCAWLASAPNRPRVFLNHGEPESCDALRLRLEDDGYVVTIATEGVVWDLESATESRLERPSPPARSADRSGVAPGSGPVLAFRDGDPEAVRDALLRMDSGAWPVLPIVVQGALVDAVRATLAPAELARVRLEP
ncbi:MAG: MBL fold metallo-hydrolase [Myxococcota bacterium]